MKRFFLVAAAALAVTSLAACSDMFSPPELPDLYKNPYDFAVDVPPYTGDGGVRDMAGITTTVHDLSSTD
ncbi:MAG TPA: hypothetical protein VGL86_12770 [Polyangia bacterium]